MPPGQRRDDRLKRIADEKAENNRNEHRLRVLQHEHDRDHREDAQRRAPDVDRNRDLRGGCWGLRGRFVTCD